MVKIAVAGVKGHMGKMIIDAVWNTEGAELVARSRTKKQITSKPMKTPAPPSALTAALRSAATMKRSAQAALRY